MVRVTFKTLQQKQFFIEAEPTETVRFRSPRRAFTAFKTEHDSPL